jgi:hypothetical protein
MFWTHAAEKGVVNDVRSESFHNHVSRFNVLASDRRRQGLGGLPGVRSARRLEDGSFWS